MSTSPSADLIYWHSTLRLMFGFFGWPFGFWATAQAALLVFCAIVWVYALLMDRLDAAYDRPAGD